MGRESRSIVVAVVTVLVLTAIAASVLRLAEREEESTRLASDATTIAASVQRELDRLADVGIDTAVSLGSVESVDAVRYEATLSALDVVARFPGLYGVTFVEVVAREDLGPWLAQRQTEGDGYELRSDAGEPVLRPIAYGFPLPENAAALGTDIVGLPDSATAARRALETGAPALSRATRIVQLEPDEAGAVMHVPLVEPDGSIRASLAMVFSGQDLLDQLAPFPANLHVELADPESELFPLVAEAGPGEPSDAETTAPVEYGDTSWAVRVSPAAGYLVPVLQRGSTLLAVGGALAALLIGLLVASVASRERRANELASSRTEELSRVNSELAAANTALVIANRSKDDFLAAVSHELRTPLTVIAGFVESLQRLPDGQRDPGPFLEPIARNVRRLDGLVADLLTLASLDADAVTVFREDLPLEDEVRRVVADLGPALTTSVELDVPAELRVRADRRHVEQVLANLLVNAARHGQPPVAVTARLVGRDVEVVVRDHGPGVALADRERVFGRFERGAGTDRSSGTGLGLAIVRELAELNGGRVRYEPASPGASFVIRLPAGASLPVSHATVRSVPR